MNKPIRPMLPNLLLPMAAAWLGIVLASELAYHNKGISPLIPFLIAAVVFFIGIRDVVTNRSRYYLSEVSQTPPIAVVLLTLFVLFLAFALGSLFYGNFNNQIEGTSELRGELELVVIEDTQSYERSRSSEALVRYLDGPEARVRIYWNDTELVIPKGSHIKARVSFSPLRADQRWLFDKGIVGTLSISEVENLGFSSDLWGAIDSFRYENSLRIQREEGDGAALLAGVLLGNRETLNDSVVEQDFLTCGLTHLIAVSGSHLVVVAALLAWFLKRLPLNRKLEVGILIFVLALYVMLTGLQAPAIRSAIMAGVAAFSVFVGRRGHAPSGLTAAALLMLLFYPANAYSIGFRLSVTAVVGITLFVNLVSHWIAALAPFQSAKAPGALSQALALTITAMSATLPIAVPAFAVLSLVAPLANLLAGPMISLVLVFGMLALVLIPFFEPLGLLLLKAAILLTDLCAQVASLLAHLPWASTPFEVSLPLATIIGIGVAAIVYFVWPLPKARTLRLSVVGAFVVVLIAIQLSPYLVSPRLVVMDVGQGDALLIQERGNTILVDTGASDSALVHALARNNVRSLDAVIITHLDSDHVGALARLRGLVPIGNIYFAQGLLEHQSDNTYLRQSFAIAGLGNVGELIQGDHLQVGNTLSLTVLWPERVALEGSNSECLCLLLDYDRDSDGSADFQALLTGDCERNELAAIITHYPGLHPNILKIGHHGSRNSLTSEQLALLESQIALISVGANNHYGHPSSEILEALNAADLLVLRTDEQGDITCLFNGSSLDLRSNIQVKEPY